MKKAQTSLMVLIILIALFMVIYVLILPPSEREVLLNQSFDDDLNDDEEDSVSTRNLLSEVPGDVFPITSNEQVHSMNSVNLYIKDEPGLKDLSSGFTVSSSLFGNKEKELSFSVDDLEDLDELVLEFVVDVSDGELIVELNEFEVMQEVVLGKVKVVLPLNEVEDNNVLLFKTSGIGAVFWRGHEYAIRDVKLKQVFERDNSEEVRSFVLNDDEFGNLDGATLRYSVFCNKGQGTLDIKMNGGFLSSESLSCVGDNKRVELSKNVLNSGENLLSFSVDRGDYLIDNLRVETSLTRSEFKKYTFLLTDGEFDDVLSEDGFVVLDMGLGDGLKLADVLVNGFTIVLDTTDSRFTRDISQYVEEGENIIEVVPKREFEIRTLKVDLE